MTLIAAFRSADGGIIVCADREESNSSAKRSVEKMQRLSFTQGTFIIAGSGCSSILAVTFEQLTAALKAEDERDGSDLFLSHRSTIVKVLRDIHQEFIWKQHDEDDRGIKLIIAAAFKSPHSIPMLYCTDEEIVYPQQLYGCGGIGEELAYYFADKLWEPKLTKQEIVIMAAFIFREVSRSVAFVGLGTDMMCLTSQNQTIQTIPASKVKELDENLPEIRDVIVKAWNQGVQIPNWLADL